MVTAGWIMCCSEHNLAILAAILNMQMSHILIKFFWASAVIYNWNGILRTKTEACRLFARSGWTDPLNDSLTQWLTHSLTHSLIHSIMDGLTLCFILLIWIDFQYHWDHEVRLWPGTRKLFWVRCLISCMQGKHKTTNTSQLFDIWRQIANNCQPHNYRFLKGGYQNQISVHWLVTHAIILVFFLATHIKW